MNVALLTHFFPPEPCAAANRMSALVQALRAQGHDVTVVTNFPSFPQRRLAPQDRFRLFDRSTGDVELVRLFSIVYKGPASRLVHWCSSAAAFTLFMLFVRQRFDTVIVTVPPITLALPALVARARHRAKLIVDVRDVYPDVAIAMGKWKPNGVLARIARTVTGILYHRASLIATVTPTAVRQIASRGVNSARLMYAPNGCDEIPQVQTGQNGRKDGFVAQYIGNLGLATDIDILIDAAAQLAREPQIRICIAGDGAESDRLRRRISAQRLKNVEYQGAVSRERAMELAANGDVSIVPLRRGIVDSVPSKLFDALGAGCPVLLAADGEATAVALQTGGAICVPAGDASALAQALRDMDAMGKQRRKRMGETGREYVRRFHRRETIMADYAARIAAAL